MPEIAAQCGKSCGLCAGLVPAPSTTCYDVYINCPVLADISCYLNSTAANCGRSCGLCPGMTPVLSVTCYDLYTNCADLAATSCYLQESGSFILSLPFIYHSFCSTIVTIVQVTCTTSYYERTAERTTELKVWQKAPNLI